MYLVASAQYDIQSIPDSLKKSADAVVRNSETTLLITDNGYTIHKHEIITLLNDNKLSFTNLYLYNAKDVKTHLIKAVIYDKNGSIIRKIKKSDLISVGDFSNFSSDMEFLVYQPSDFTYPCTIEYEYESKVDYLFILPDWNPAFDYSTAVENASLSIKSKNKNLLRYYEKNIQHNCIVETKENITEWRWNLRNFAAVKKYENMLPKEFVLPMVLLAPSKINYQNYVHDFNSWQDLGEWIKLLNKNKDVLSPDLKKKVHLLTDNLVSDYEKIKALYEFMQNNTRYVSIQYGIGGFKPFAANYVYERGYGDCKALSNYMYAMLNEINIKAYYTLVKAGQNENIIKEFPASQFNHAIVCVPLKNNDTLWLENTAQDIPFAYNGDFTDDRDVLIISEQPTLVHTNLYSSTDTKTSNTITASMLSDGQVEIKLNQKVQGLFYRKLLPVKYAPSSSEKEQTLQKYFGFTNATLQETNITEEKNRIPQFNLNVKITATIIKQSANRLFIPVLFIPDKENKYETDSLRISSFFEPKNYSVSDSIAFIIPENYILDSKEINQFFSCKAGHYSLKTSKSNNLLIISRELVINKGVYSNHEWKQVNAFYKNVKKADASIIILKKIL